MGIGEEANPRGGANPGGARGTGPLPLQKKGKNKKKGMKGNRIHDLKKKKI